MGTLHNVRLKHEESGELMAQNDDWNSFIQSRPMRILLNAICAVCCGFYAVGGVRDLISPSDSSQVLLEQMGTTGFYAMTVIRTLVCVWVAVVFARMAYKAFKDVD